MVRPRSQEILILGVEPRKLDYRFIEIYIYIYILHNKKLCPLNLCIHEHYEKCGSFTTIEKVAGQSDQFASIRRATQDYESIVLYFSP